MPELFLASASPRRASLLEQVGVRFRVCPVDIDEQWRPAETIRNYVARLAREKCQAAAAKLPAGSAVLAADTAGICGDTRLTKPLDQHDAIRMLMGMSGRWHTVSTAVSLYCGGQMETCIVNSEVLFRPLTRQECLDYWATGEPCDKAGSYAIQGLGAVFVERIVGSYSGVVGLPLCETAALLKRFGIPCWDMAGQQHPEACA